MASRAKPQLDLFRACALLQIDGSSARDAHAEALMRCLSEAFGQPARLHAPGVAELTFDEHWLIRLGQSCVQGDNLSIRFLLGSRIKPENRRLVRFLVTQTFAQTR